MGLDLLEFVLAVENAFGLAIPDQDAGSLRTPGLLVDYLESRLTRSPNAPCLHQRAFYRLRRSGMKVLGRPRAAFAPDTPWDSLLHTDKHQREWMLVQRDVGVQSWPRLKPVLSFRPVTQTVGETAKWLATNAAAALIEPGEGWNRRLIEDVISRLMEEELGVKVFRWTDRWGRDLGVE